MKNLKYLVFLSIIFISGCKTLTYERPGHKFVYTNLLFNTKAGKVSIITPEGIKIEMENLSSDSQALNVAEKALDLANKIP